MRWVGRPAKSTMRDLNLSECKEDFFLRPSRFEKIKLPISQPRTTLPPPHFGGVTATPQHIAVEGFLSRHFAAACRIHEICEKRGLSGADAWRRTPS